MHDQTTSTPRTNAVAHFGHDSATYISKMTDVARQLDGLLEQSLNYADRAGRWRHVADALAEELRVEWYDGDNITHSKALAAYDQLKEAAK